MINKRILVLANSTKHHPMSCVAGRELIDEGSGKTRWGGWIRPVSNHDEGALNLVERRLADTKDSKPLDVIQLPLAAPDNNPLDYVHLPELAPTQDILDAYKKHKGDWNIYERQFIDLMAQRKIEKKIQPELLQNGCLLCSEHLPHHCHRRLVAEYLNAKWGGINTNHLV